ncbi:MAG: S8 family peptidase, partial [Anaerolineales bacterium]|nr:S8 family peptidase [Anaerolineales bacterium]
DDPLLSLQWHLTDPAGGIRAAAAWAVTAGVTDVVVAVIDTGLVPHPDLAADRVLPGYDFVSDLFMANDGDARDADPADPGDWVTAQETVTQPACFGYPPMNSSWHGTHVTGVIAAQGGNGQGVAGVAWGVRVLPVRALGKCGGADSDIADAMLWAAGLASGDPSVPDNPTPAQILNLSLGGGEQCAATVYQPVVDQLRAAGVLVIAAAGNDGGPVSAPANCEGVLAVAANNRAGDLSNFSSYGPEVALTAPGGESGQDYIYSLYNSGVTGPAGATYAGFTGTSAAAPQVAGAAALVKSFNPQLTGLQLAAILTTTTHPLAEGGRCLTDPALGGQCGWGILDAGAAVNAAAGVVQALSPAVAPPGSGDLILTVTGQHFLAGAQVLWAGSPLATSFVDAGVLTATVPAARLAAPGAAAVAVLNPGAGAASFTPAQFIIGTSFYLPAIQRGS